MRSISTLAFVVISLSIPMVGQMVANEGATTPTDLVANSSIPVLVKFTGVLGEPPGTLTTGPRGITFALYDDQTGGAPLWMETQTVFVDFQGHFTAILGSATPNGIPSTVFDGQHARWVGVILDDGQQRPRAELSSAPYAFEAADAQTLGGKTPAEFVTQEELDSAINTLKGTNIQPWSGIATNAPQQAPTGTVVPSINADLLHGLSDSAFAKLAGENQFFGTNTFAGGLAMPANHPESNKPNAIDSAPVDFESSISGLQSSTSAATQRFRWISQPLPPSSNGPAAQLSLLFGANNATPTPTGLSINSDGTINFAPGQQFSNAGSIGGGNSINGLGAGGGSGTGAAPFVNSSHYNWSETPSVKTGIVVGPNTITMKPCPRGLNGTDQWHYLYISGTGTPEVVLLTGGSCRSGASQGTIQFTAKYPHPSGYSIGSASDGIQEAIIAAAVPNTNGQISRQVIIDPGSHLIRARVSVRSSSMTIISSGATLACAMRDTCLMLGDPTDANLVQAPVVQGLRVAPGVPGGTWTAVEDNAQASQILDLAPAVSSISGSSFGSLIQIDNDQAAVINGLTVNPNYGWGQCNSIFCSTVIVGPGPYSTNAGVIWVQNANISLQCGGNGIDDQDGNTLRVSNSVVQGYAQFGIRARTVYQIDTVQLNGVYEEEDGYCNPLGTGSAGLIVEGGQATTSASASAGLMPQFSNTGSTQYYYYVVVHSSTAGVSPVYLAGFANTNGSGAINVLWNQVGATGTVSYDVLRQTGNAGPQMQAPYGTGSFAVATGIPASACNNHVCAFTDNASSTPATYTVQDITPYWPSLKLWPGTIILTTPNDYINNGGGNPTAYYTDELPQGDIINSGGATYPSVFAQECNPMGNWSAIWMNCQNGNSAGNDWQPVAATLIQVSGTGGSQGGLKGRYIFEMPPGSETNPTEVITLADANVDKTLATPLNRPSWDANDSYIGYDGGYYPSQMGIAIGGPISISRYIANVPNGTSYVERLTATNDQYRVPISLSQQSFANLVPMPNGTVLYCLDCQNVHDDGVLFDSPASGGGHGTNVVFENGQWRVH
jgi:hypothetical protein